jgi:Uma2 family endonuclease
LRDVTSTRRRATYDDLMRVPDTMVAEIIDGELITSPRPAVRHAHCGSVIGADLIGSFHGPPGSPDKPGGWWILFEPELHFGKDVIVPDVAGWRRDRLPVLPDVAALEQAPDWVCEILSPGTTAVDRGKKMRIYAREGVAHLWLVDAIARTLEIYRLEHGRWCVAATHAGDAVVRAEPFAAVELALGRWWLPT